MSSFDFRPGTLIQFKGQPHQINRFLPGDFCVLDRVADAMPVTVKKSDLEGAFGSGHLRFLAETSGQVTDEAEVEQLLRAAFAAYPAHLQLEAMWRKNCIDVFDRFEAEHRDGLVTDPGDTVEIRFAKITNRGVHDLPSVSTVRRWRRTFANCQSDVRSLVPRIQRRGRRNQISATVLELALATLDASYLTEQRNTLSETLSLLGAAIDKHNATLPESCQLKKPSIKLLRRLVKQIDRYELTKRRHGKAYADRKFRAALRSGDIVEAPLDRVEIDHTIIDLIVVDDKTGLPIGRPTITVAIDRKTRCILGFSISFEPPSYVSVMRCLAHAIKPKTYLAEKYPDLKNPWPCWGLPVLVPVDNGREFHSHDFITALAGLGIDVRYCPTAQPWWKGAVERFFRTLNTGLIHMLPGTTFSNIVKREDYDSSANALITLDSLEKLLHMWIVDVYHQTPHRALLIPPLLAWQKAGPLIRQSLPSSVELLDVALRSTVTRTLFHYGLEIAYLRYNSEELGALFKRVGSVKMDVKLDKSDLARVYVYDEKLDRYLDVPCSDFQYANGITLWQHKLIHAKAEAEFGGTGREQLEKAKEALRHEVASMMQDKRLTTRKRAKRAQFDASDASQSEPAQSANPALELEEIAAAGKRVAPKSKGQLEKAWESFSVLES
jgi:putative transposase